MGVLDGKAAIVTGSARGIGRATAELLAEQGAKVLINDLDGDVAEQAAREIDGETAVFAGDLTKAGRPRRARRRRPIDEFGADRHHRQQRRLHLGRRRPQDDRRAVPGDARHPHRRARSGSSAPPRRTCASPPRRSATRARRSSARSSTSPRSRARWATPARSTTRPRRPGVVGLTKTLAKEWGQFKINVNAVAFGFVETRLTAAKEEGGEIEHGRRGDRARHPRADARDGLGDHPARPPGDARGGRRPGLLPLLAAGQLRARPGAERDRRQFGGMYI